MAQEQITTLAKRLEPFLLASITNYVSESAPSATWGKILVQPVNNPAAVRSYDRTSAGLIAANAEHNSNEFVWIPPSTYTAGTLTWKDNVAIASMGGNYVRIEGKQVFNGDAYLKGLVLSNSGSGGTVTAIQGPPAGYLLLLNDCTSTADNTGTGPAHAITSDGGTVFLWGSNVEASATGGTAYAVYQNGGALEYRFSKFEAWSGGTATNPIGIIGGTAVLASAVGQGVAYPAGINAASAPDGWYEVAYDDSGWNATVASSPGYPPAITGTQSVAYRQTDQGSPADTNETHLIRHDFTLDAEQATKSMLVQLNAEDQVLALFLNGLFVTGDYRTVQLGAEYLDLEFILDSSFFVEGTNNLAVMFANSDGYAIGISYKITPIIGSPTYAVQMVEAGAQLAEPEAGDRAAWRLDYQQGKRHASDIFLEAFIHHVPSALGQSGKAPVSDGIRWQLSDILTQAELDAHAADPAAHHDPVTVVDTATVNLTLTGQQITADVIPSAIDLDDLGDVAAPSPTDGQVLVYDADTSTWGPGSVSSASGALGELLVDDNEGILYDDQGDVLYEG
jgi:hypothetical protein